MDTNRPQAAARGQQPPTEEKELPTDDEALVAELDTRIRTLQTRLSQYRAQRRRALKRIDIRKRRQ